ncbi:MAG: FtsW/RodA/SpoVE family cell cycle protein [Pseudomonadota bacterium]
MTALSRLDRSLLSRWWWSVDRPSFLIVAAIVFVGFILQLAAGPAAAARLHIDNGFHFPLRQAVFLPAAAALVVGVSMLTPLQARRVGVLAFVGAFACALAVLVAGAEINGARRWMSFGAFSLQPSEFLKPGFVVVAAWMLSEAARRPGFPGAPIAMALYLASAALLVMQPDYGQAALLTAVWMLMFFIAGWSWLWIGGLGAIGLAALYGGYRFSPHVSRRIDGFVNPSGAESYQVDRSLEAIRNGGFFGRGGDVPPVKDQLPDAHTDFIFAVAAEEFGYFFGLLILALYAALLLRLYLRAAALKSVFAQCAACGLAAMVGLQAVINVGVSMRALPAKGMTLPFVSYGGSSLLAMGLSLGLAFALTRRARPAVTRREMMA